MMPLWVICAISLILNITLLVLWRLEVGYSKVVEAMLLKATDMLVELDGDVNVKS